MLCHRRELCQADYRWDWKAFWENNDNHKSNLLCWHRPVLHIVICLRVIQVLGPDCCLHLNIHTSTVHSHLIALTHRPLCFVTHGMLLLCCPHNHWFSLLCLAGGSGSTPCIGHITPGTPARGCTANTASKGYINNQGPGQATLYYTASNQQCPGKIGVASITVACADQNTLAFTLMSAARRGGGNTRFVYVSCSRVPLDQTCPGVKWLRIGGQQAPATSTVGAGGAQIVNFNATIASGAGCTCSTAYWAVYTAGTFNGLPRSVCTV